MSEMEGESRVKEILVASVRFVLLSLVLLLVQHLISNFSLVKAVKNGAYDLLQSRLARATDPSQEIVIVDINGFPRTPREDLRKGRAPTSRSELLRLLTKVADSGATAIGVDVDFSPEDDGNYVMPDDPEFFRMVQALSRLKHVPIFLGVWRQAAAGSENWLADPKFADLAAGLPVPRESAIAMPIYIETQAGQPPLPTMAAAMAATAVKLQEEPPRWTMGLLEYRLEKHLQAGLNIQEILVDYSQLEQFIDHRISWQSVMKAGTMDGLKHRLILVGDATPPLSSASEDWFRLPGRTGQFAGVFLHGSATYSALKAPLYEFKPGGDAWLDLIVGGALLTIIVMFQIVLRRDSDRHPKAARYTTIAYYATAVLMLVGGVWFVNVTRTLWDDFPIFIVALLLHHSAETFIEKRLERHHAHSHHLSADLPEAVGGLAEPELDADATHKPEPGKG